MILINDTAKTVFCAFLAFPIFLMHGEDWFRPENLTAEQGQFTRIMQNGSPAVKLSGFTGLREAPDYFSGTIRLPRPIDLVGKHFCLTIESEVPERIVELSIRFYNQGEKESCWGFMSWGDVFENRSSFSVRLAGGKSERIPWRSNMANGKAPARIDRIQLRIGSMTARSAVHVIFRDFKVEPVGERPWFPAKYSNRPARVVHPVVSIKKKDIERAKNNIAHDSRGRKILADMRKNAAFWMDLKLREISDWIPADDAWGKCLCPNCGAQPEFAWELQADLKSVRCKKCRMVFPNSRYPENRSYTVRTPRGKWKTIRYYHGRDQISQNENFGPRYHLSGAVNYQKLRKLYRLRDVAGVYAVTGEKAYAERVRDILLRFAEVYPDYVYKFRATAFENPLHQKMAGKLCDWKYFDSIMLPHLLDAYSMTYDSGVYSKSDKLSIENGICREYKHMITAFPPTADWVQNAVPAHMTAAACCAAILGDHALMDWLLQGPDGLPAFLKRYYRRDGLWYENSAAYGNMAADPLVELVEVLQGYSDNDDYRKKDRYESLDLFSLIPSLEKIFTGMAAATLPTGFLPAFNDSQYYTRQSSRQLELVSQLKPSLRNKALLRWFTANNPGALSSSSLFKRDLESREKPPAIPEALTCSTVMPGAGWALLRHPETCHESAVAMTFGPYMPHGHNSMLNYLYCDYGREVVSDLGYLSWGHPNRVWLSSALAHNLVVVDGKPQSRHRTALPELFAPGPTVQAMRFNAPMCYPDITSEYSRMIFDIPLSGRRRYLLDFFRVSGGEEHLWSFHADGEKFTAPDRLRFSSADRKILGNREIGSGFLENLRCASLPGGVWNFRWRFDEKVVTMMTLLTEKPGNLFLADAPGLRDQHTPYAKVKLNLVLLKQAGPDNWFISLVESSDAISRIHSCRLLKTSGRSARAVEVVTADGIDLIVLAAPGTGMVEIAGFPQYRITGRSAVIRLTPEKRLRSFWQENAPSRGIVTRIDGHVLHTSLDTLPQTGYLLAEKHTDGLYRIASAHMQDNKAVVTVASDEVVRLEPGDPIQVYNYLIRLPTDGKP